MRAVVPLLLALAACRPAAAPPPAAPSVAALPPADPVLAPLAFLVGDWRIAEGTMVVEEHWGAPAGGSMIGYSRTLDGARLASFEFMRIAVDDGVPVFLASPQGRDPATPFAVAEVTADRVVFANAAHDFPQRIVYTCAGDELAVELHGVAHGKPAEQGWSYRRVPGR